MLKGAPSATNSSELPGDSNNSLSEGKNKLDELMSRDQILLRWYKGEVWWQVYAQWVNEWYQNLPGKSTEDELLYSNFTKADKTNLSE